MGWVSNLKHMTRAYMEGRKEEKAQKEAKKKAAEAAKKAASSTLKRTKKVQGGLANAGVTHEEMPTDTQRRKRRAAY